MGQNRQKHVTSREGKSKYAIKHEAQNRGHFSVNSPFGNTREHKEEKQAQAENTTI